MRTVAILFIGLVAAYGCGGDDSPAVAPAPPPSAVTVSVTTNVDTVFVSWTAASGATSYRAELTGSDTMSKTTTGLEATYTTADGLTDSHTYTAQVYAINAEGETVSSNTPTVTTNYFPWDEYFATSLHATGMGKKTFYNTTPNGGFEHYTGIAYSELSCQNCHLPEKTGGCTSCHEEESPQLGAQVDATLTGVCGSCHGRQKGEAITHGFADVHRDAGMDCMACHTLGDVHGDGTAYSSMLEDGAIDAACGDCHTTLASNSYHNTHSSTVDCTACHTQSVVTCYNCHFETEVELDQKKAYGQFKNWLFLVNRNGKVHSANFQSLSYAGNTMVGMAPFYSHTIAKSARTCSDCHGNPNVDDWFDDGVIDVVVWDATQGKLVPTTGVVPVPPNFLDGGLRFDFADLDQPGGTVWSFLKSGADRIHLLFGEPLTQEQMNKIR